MRTIECPFGCSEENVNLLCQFDVTFDVIEANPSFLLGLPTPMAVKATADFKHHSLGINVGGRYPWMVLLHRGGHLLFPFASTSLRIEGETRNNTAQSTKFGFGDSSLGTPHYQSHSNEVSKETSHGTPHSFKSHQAPGFYYPAIKTLLQSTRYHMSATKLDQA